MIRPEVEAFLTLGPLPSSDVASPEAIARLEDALLAIRMPTSDTEAKHLCLMFGPDDCFGLAWALLHLVESAPSWPMKECFAGQPNEWVKRLYQRAQNAGLA